MFDRYGQASNCRPYSVGFNSKRLRPYRIIVHEPIYVLLKAEAVGALKVFSHLAIVVQVESLCSTIPWVPLPSAPPRCRRRRGHAWGPPGLAREKARCLWGTFVRRRAEQLEQASRDPKYNRETCLELARHHRNLAKLIAWRWWAGVESSSIVPGKVTRSLTLRRPEAYLMRVWVNPEKSPVIGML